jgi:hypothetical protein
MCCNGRFAIPAEMPIRANPIARCHPRQVVVETGMPQPVDLPEAGIIEADREFMIDIRKAPRP